MKRYAHYLSLLLLTLTAVACNPDDESTSPVTPHGAQVMQIEITKQPFTPGNEEAKTRVAHDGNYNATFKSGDRIGIIGISGSEIVFNNYEYQYENEIWKAVDNNRICYAQPNMTYIAYYPYSADMNGKKNETEILNAFNLPIDQTTPSDENDLMAATVTVTTATNEVTFNMQHLLCLLELAPPTYTYEWDNTNIPITMHPDNILKNFIYYNHITYEIGKNSKYLLVKPGRDQEIYATEYATPDNGIKLETNKKTITISNKHYVVNRKFKLTFPIRVGDPFYMNSNKFAFPYAKGMKNAPVDCQKIGTVTKIGNSFDGVSDPRLTYTRSDEQTYRTINNTILDKVRGYIASDYKYNGPLFDKNQNNKAPSSIDSYNVHGFTYTYQYCTDSKPYQYLKENKNHPTNTSKWFIPGVAEAYAILDILPDNTGENYWTCDRMDENHNYYFKMYAKKVFDKVEYHSDYCNTIFMLAF